MRSVQTPIRLTVFVHVYYIDVWEQLALILDREIDIPFDLVITGPYYLHEIPKPRTSMLRSMRALVCENRGRDILPFLIALEGVKPFDVGLKLHTKRSPHHHEGKAWRNSIIASLLEDGASTRILSAFENDLRLGFVSPAGMLLDLRLRSGACWLPIAKVLTRLGLPLLSKVEQRTGVFIAGTMFYFRAAAMPTLPVEQLNDMFELEAGQTDGTTAHALERLMPVLSRRAGFYTSPESRLTEVIGSNFSTIDAVARDAVSFPARFFLRLPTPVMWLLENFPKQMSVVRHLPLPVKTLIRKLVGMPAKERPRK